MRSSFVSFYNTEQHGILQRPGAEWHPSTPRSIVASFNTTEQRRCSVVMKDAALLSGVEG
jgi:hypothetical protein